MRFAPVPSDVAAVDASVSEAVLKCVVSRQSRNKGRYSSCFLESVCVGKQNWEAPKKLLLARDEFECLYSS